MQQNIAPIYEALLNHKKKRVVPFDVPGHKGGRGTPLLTEFLGQDCLKVDVNSMKPLDNLCHPVSVILEAEKLAADAFGAAHAFFMVGGTTSSVQAMIMTACKSGDKIILPRNVHRSVINALVVCGAEPVYVNPGLNKRLGIPLGMSKEDVEKAVKAHPEAKAVLVNNPTYYGICSDISEIVRIAHNAGMLVLADEAHGTHFYFGDNLPMPAIKAGADMAAVSMHKTGGSLTQSSFLLIGKNVNLHKGCTIGRTSGKNGGSPKIGDQVFVGINATIVGNVVIGNDVLIAPNSFVNFDVPSHSVVIGNPGKIYTKEYATGNYICFCT